MKVGIVTIGNELTSGKTQDTNSSFIARQMNAQGWETSVMMSIPDDEGAIKKVLDYAMSLSDAVVITGGLGPTADDITTAAVAKAFGLGIRINQEALAHIKDRFEKFKLKWTANNEKQAHIPDGAEAIRNHVGLAWGYSLKKNGKVISVIPGVPAEVKRMVPDGVIPVLRKEFGNAAGYVKSGTLKLTGITEASVDQTLADVDFAGLGVNIGFYPNFPEIQIVLTAIATTEDEARKKILAAESQVLARLRQYVFAYDQDTLEGIVAALLTQKKLTIAVAESCTGGLLTDRLTDVAGSSVYLERGVISYSNESKMDLLGVSLDVLREFGAVSEKTAVAMAEGVRRLGKCDLGISTTGIAGPSGGSPEKPVGTVFIALADGTGTFCRNYTFRWDRRRNKTMMSQAALMLLKRYLTGELQHE
ncbi:MAG TPA: competence/damage-inducible protein A [Syntrophales bacterium]|nr:competence/damage-inducible protein A [Syntrophales bacterium]